MTPEQQKALALSKARRRRAEAEGQGKQTWGEWVYGNVVGNPDDDVINFGESLGTWLNRAGESATLGLVGDEASASAYSMLPGRTYDAELARFRDNEDAMSGLGQISADIAGGIAPAMLGVGAMASSPTLGAAALRGAGIGAGAGAVQGFMEGEDGLADRMGGAALGGTVGGALGAVIPVAGDMARRGVRGVSDWARNSNIAGSVGNALGIDPGAAKALTGLVSAQDPNSIAAALAKSGDTAMLADVPALTGVLDATMRSPTPGAQSATGRIAERAGTAGEDIINALRGGKMGPYKGAIATEKGINASSRAVVNPAYEKAYSKAIDYSAPSGMAVEELISRIPPKQLKKAVDSATDRMIYDGIPPQVMASIAEDGSVTLSQKPNVMMMDYLKRAFDDIAEDGKDPLTGKMTADAAFASRVARDIRETTKEAVPEYAEALSVAATGIKERTAVREGGKILNPNMTVEQVNDLIADATPAERRLMKEGLVAQIEHKLGNIKAVGTDQNIDAREAAKSWSDLSSRNTQDKLKMLFGDEWPSLQETLDRAGSAVGLRANTAANSATAGRMATNDLIDEIAQPGALASGQPLQAAKNAIGGITGASPESVAALKQDIRSQLADVLTRQGGSAQDAVRVIAEALAKNPMNMAAGKGVEQIVRALGLTALPQVTGAANEVFN